MDSYRLAYIAGFFDAEGAIIIRRFKTKTNLRYQLALSLANVDQDLLYQIRASFDNFGSIGKKTKIKYKNQRCTYEWQLGSKQAMSFLKQVYPFLIVKKSEAAVGNRFSILTL